MVSPNQFALQEQSITEDSNSIIVNKVFFTSPPPFWIYYSIPSRKCKVSFVGTGVPDSPNGALG